MNDNVLLNNEQTEEIKNNAEATDNSEAVTEAAATGNSLENEPDDVTSGGGYADNYYLLYGGAENNHLDLDAAKSFLEALGFDGGELRQARNGKDAYQLYTAEENANQMYCSYCGLEISGVEYQRLPDGRLRCTSCSKSLVKSEMQELCDRVKSNMESFFGASINVPIHIEVLEERKLKKKIKSPLSMIDDKSILVLGAAVNDKKGYRIYLENGAPRISVIATFAHELTHIWQYMNWDNKKGFKVCPKKNRLLIYEGMAKWAEIQYLYLIGETAVAKREEYITRNREDEYGTGFNLIENKYPLTYATIVCENSPFLKDEYPAI